MVSPSVDTFVTVYFVCCSMLRALDLGGGERSLERKPELRSPSTAPSLRDNSVERERSAERRDTGTSLVVLQLLDLMEVKR